MGRLPLLACLAVLAAQPAAADIAAARYDSPTTRYAHGVLGDAVEWGALVLSLSNGEERRFTLPASRVFEDIAPRLADIDLDGTPEVVTVEASLANGARLAGWRRSRRPISMATGMSSWPMSTGPIWPRPCVSGAIGTAPCRMWPMR